MIEKPMDVLDLFPVRKKDKQKEDFRREALTFLSRYKYSGSVEKGSRNSQNLVIGDPETAKYLITAHYDTPASIGLPNILTPCNPVTFILWQVLLVGILLAVSIGLAAVGYLLSSSERVALLVWYVVYFGILFLMLFGPANKHNANDNTSGVVTLLETAIAWPEEKAAMFALCCLIWKRADLLAQLPTARRTRLPVRIKLC